MDKYLQVWVLTIIFSAIFLGIVVIVFLKYYIPVLGLLFISLGIYLFYLETIQNKEYSVQIIKYILIIIPGIYFIISGKKMIV